MAFTLLLRRSSVPGHQPTTAQLNVGELSMNSNDGILYFMQQNSTTLANTIVSIAPSTYLTSMVASGDVSGTSSGNAITLTLASVGTAGTYSAVITDAKGRVTGSTALTFTGDATGSGSGASIALTLATVATAGTFAVTTFNAKGLVTSGANLVATGDATGTSSGTGLALTLATVNTTPGTFGTATIIPTITVNGKGLVTSISNTAITGVGLLGYTPLNAANASVTVTGAATGTASFAGSNNVSVALTLAASGVTAGTYSSVTVSSTGLVTAGGNITASGDATGTVAGTALALTLATVNSNIGSFGSNTAVATFTVNAKGLVTAAGSTAINVVSALGYTPVNNAIVGVANGIATLNSSGQLTASQIPASIVGAVVYQGTWNASTNTPTLTSSTGTKGWYYKVSVAGSTTVDGISTWNIGDTIIFDGTTWDKIDGIAAEVLSFNTRTGAITLTSSDVTTALGFTPQGAIVVTGDVSGTATQNAITLTLANVATAGTFAVTTFNAKGLVTSGANLVATGDATGTSSGSGLALTLASSGATAGVYGSATQIPTITVNAKGLVTSISNTAITGVGLLGFTPLNQANASVTLAGDATGTASFAGTNAVTVTTTLATVNSNVGTFVGITVNAKGLVTAAANVVTFAGYNLGVGLGPDVIDGGSF